MQAVFVIFISTFIVYLFFVSSPPTLSETTAKPAAKNLEAACTQSNPPPPTNTEKPNWFTDYSAVVGLAKELRSDWSTDCPAVAGLIKELEKANTEIQSRLTQEGQWFYLKYLFAGALMAALLLEVFIKTNKEETPDKRLDELSRTPSVAFVLALATVVAISVDLQIVSGRMVIEELGLWIESNVEPALFQDPATGDWVVKGWEHFLWADKDAYHTSILYAHTFWPNIFYITLVLYGSFIYIIWHCRKNCSSSLMVVGYWLVHITLAVAAISSHYVPSGLKVIPFPLLYFLTGLLHEPAWPPYAHPNWTFLTYGTLFILLIFIHWIVGIPLRFHKKNAKGWQLPPPGRIGG